MVIRNNENTYPQDSSPLVSNHLPCTHYIKWLHILMFLKKLHILFDFLFPIYCCGCQKNGVILCDACSSRITKASFDDFEKKQIYAVFDYQDKTSKRLLWALKYKGSLCV